MLRINIYPSPTGSLVNYTDFSPIYILTPNNVTNAGEEGEDLLGCLEEGGETEQQASKHTEE